MSAPRRPSSTTARRRRFLAPLPAVLAVLLTAGLAGPAAADARLVDAATLSPTPTPTAGTGEDDDEQRARLTLTPSAGTIGGEDEVAATASIESPLGPAAVPAGTVTLRIGDQPLPDRVALEAWLDGSSSARLVDLDTAEAGVTAPGASQTITLREDERTTARAPGVYPLRAALSGGGQRLEDDALVLVEGGTRPSIAVVVPLTAPATDRGLLTSEQLAQLTVAGGSLTTQLEAVAGTQAVLAVDPAIPAAIRALGSSAPTSAITWLERLESLPNERFALGFGDADPAVQIAAGFGDPLAPLSLAPYLPGAGEPAPQPSPEPTGDPTPTPTPSPTASAAPDPGSLDLEELLSIGGDPAAVGWPDPAAVDAATVAALRDAGSASLVPSTATAAGADGAPVPPRADGALVYDAAASELLSAAAALEDERAREEALAAARASLWLAAGEVGGTLLVALERQGGVDAGDDRLDRDPSPRPAEAVSDAVATASSFAPLTLAALLAAAPVPVDVTGPGPDAARVAAANEMHGREDRLTQLGSILNDPTLLTARARAETLQLLGTPWSAHPDAWEAAVAAERESITALGGAVGIVPPSDVQLLSSEAPLPVWIRNDLPYPVTVTLHAQPDNPRVAVQETTTVEAAPSQNTRVRVPVEAGIGNGQVRISLSLQSPTGVAVGAPQAIDVTVRADWERAAMIVLGVLVAGLAVLGTIRTVRRRRRRAAAAGRD